jgi:acetylornithine deacetylase
VDLVARLTELVSFDTQNPSGSERPMVDKLAADLRALGAASVEVADTQGHSYVYARFGGEAPRLILNAHVDTVPANSGYTAPPHQLVRRGDRLHGLGAADTKGAIAAILCALEARFGALEARGGRPLPAPIGVLFSGDEERSGVCIRAFLASPAARGVQQAIVCEPTRCRIGWRHRGIGSARAGVSGPGGHSSRADATPNPIAILARAAVALDDFGRAERAAGPPGFEGLCLNIAAIDGGIAFNVIPSSGALVVSVRPAPGVSTAAVLAEVERRARAAAAPHVLDWQVLLSSPSFRTNDVAPFQHLLGSHGGAPTDLAFWTEAALLTEHGVDAVVFGPGDIAQAHAADEWVEVSELERAEAAFQHVLAHADGR